MNEVRAISLLLLRALRERYGLPLDTFNMLMMRLPPAPVREPSPWSTAYKHGNGCKCERCLALGVNGAHD